VFFWKKEKEILDKIFTYLATLDEVNRIFHKVLKKSLNKPQKDRQSGAEKLHQAESLADDLRREIERDLYQKALLPESRGDILEIVEMLDRIPGILEKVAFDLYIQGTVFPEELLKGVKSILKHSEEAWPAVKQGVEDFFYNRDPLPQVDKIDQEESTCDVLERETLTILFNLDIPKADKLELKSFVELLSSITDEYEIIGDKLAIAFAKRAS